MLFLPLTSQSIHVPKNKMNRREELKCIRRVFMLEVSEKELKKP